MRADRQRLGARRGAVELARLLRELHRAAPVALAAGALRERIREVAAAIRDVGVARAQEQLARARGLGDERRGLVARPRLPEVARLQHVGVRACAIAGGLA